MFGYNGDGFIICAHALSIKGLMLIIIKFDSTSCFKTTATGQDGAALQRHGVAHTVCSSLICLSVKKVYC